MQPMGATPATAILLPPFAGRPLMRSSILVLSAVLLAACGQAGSLYLPDAPDEPAPAQRQPAEAPTPPAADEAEARKQQSETSPDTPAQ